MTQNTQTTVDRIQAIIEAGLFDFSARPACEVIAAEIDALTADNAQANQWLVNGVAKIERLEKERDEARAEVERLRPAADAWEKQEARDEAHYAYGYGPDRELAALWTKYSEANEIAKAAAARARAAKEGQP